jgi:hypothetical protein
MAKLIFFKEKMEWKGDEFLNESLRTDLQSGFAFEF